MADVEVEQTTIPVPSEPTESVCAYCREPAYEKLIAEKGGTKKINQAITFWVCPKHLAILTKNNPNLLVVGDLRKDVTNSGKPKKEKPKSNWAHWDIMKK